MSIPLRTYQQRLLERWATLPEPRRLFLAWDMGAGKTLAALKCVVTSKATRVLVICPALVRSQWVRESERHLPGLSAGAVEVGTGIKNSKAANERRAAALGSNVVVTSYDLTHTIPRLGWHFIIVDEFHALRSVSSKQSQMVRALFAANPTASALGLSGTPIPNEAKQLWNPVDTFFPERWGKQSRKGFEPFSFVNRFCNKETNEYGTRFVGLRDDRAEELSRRFSEISDRVVQADFANFLPPLYVEPIEIKARQMPLEVASQWVQSLPQAAQHVGIYCHLRDTAKRIHNKYIHSLYIDGSMPSSERDRILQKARDQPQSILVATTHALAEGISLSFQKAALIVEWTSDVANVVQFLGRFSRQDSTSLAPTRVNIAIGPNDVGAAQTIRERVGHINSLIRSSRSTDVAASAFAEQQMSDDVFFEQLQSIAVSQEKRAQLWSDGDDDDGDDD